MRFVTFDKAGVETVGVRKGQKIVDLSLAAPDLPRTLLALIQSGALNQAGSAADGAKDDAICPEELVKYLPVIPRPPKFFGFGINYGSHVGERPETPGFFISSPTRLIGHREAMEIPKVSRTLDYEIELAIIIGRGGKAIAAEDALDHIAGYTIFNDGSVRGHGAGNTLTLMKNSDRTGSLGPELVTPDELSPGGDGLRLTTRRNGIVVQDDTTSNMFWKTCEIIEMTSSYMSLEAGDVITTGTCGGTIVETAIARSRQLSDESLDWLKPGDIVECEIEGIGVLMNPVVLEGEPTPRL